MRGVSRIRAPCEGRPRRPLGAAERSPYDEGRFGRFSIARRHTRNSGRRDAGQQQTLKMRVRSRDLRGCFEGDVIHCVGFYAATFDAGPEVVAIEILDADGEVVEREAIGQTRPAPAGGPTPTPRG